MDNEPYVRSDTGGDSDPARRPGDAESTGVICYEAFKDINSVHGFPTHMPGPEFGIGLLNQLISHPGFYCVVAEAHGQIIGSNCLDERGVIAGVGPVTVSPEIQSQGTGRRLMQAILDRARERQFPGVRLLQSTYNCRALSSYCKLGFDAREPMSIMQGVPIKASVDGIAVRPALSADLEAANRVCEIVHGHNRSGELREAIARGTAFVAVRESRITGYVSEMAFFGHAVGESNADLRALIGAADTFAGPGILVPTRNAELFRWCLDRGLRVVEPMTLMSIGLYNKPAGAYLPSILY